MRCPNCKISIPNNGLLEEIIEEIVFREVHNHEVDIASSVHPCELRGLREILKENGKIYIKEQ